MSGKQVSGSLSSRVMNMKFMRFSSDNDVTTDATSSKESSVDNTTSTFRDNSEWSLSDNSNNNSAEKSGNDKKLKTIRLNVKRKHPLISRQVNSSTFGVTMLQRGRLSVKGKTMFGGEAVKTINQDEETKKRSLDDANEDGNDNDDKDKSSDGYDLDKIFKDTLKKKHNNNNHNNNNNPPNKKSKKNKKTKKQRKN